MRNIKWYLTSRKNQPKEDKSNQPKKGKRLPRDQIQGQDRDQGEEVDLDQLKGKNMTRRDIERRIKGGPRLMRNKILRIKNEILL